MAQNSFSRAIFTMYLFCYPVYSLVSSDFDLTPCGITKACLKSSASCNASSCLHAVTLANTTSPVGYLEIELMGKVISSSAGYIAVGFSKDATMGDDSVIGCYLQADGKIITRPSYNNRMPLRNIFLTQDEYTSDFIQNQDTDPNRLGGAFDAITNQLYCRFRLKLIPTSTNSTRIFDLTSQIYYVLLARGTSIYSAGYSKHVAGGTIVSQVAVNITTAAKAILQSQPRNYDLVKVHGSLMIFSWVLFASVGIFTARHMKDMCPDQRPIGEKVWFLLHVGCQAFCCLSAAVGFILIFVYVRGYSSYLESPASAHPILGIITCGLAFANPVIAAFRCHPEHPRRPIFNIVHFAVGTLAQIFAVPSIALGLKMHHQDGSVYSFTGSLAILMAFVAFHIILNVTLWLVPIVSQKKQHNLESGSSGKQWRHVKYVAGSVHAILAVACSVTLVVLIALNN